MKILVPLLTVALALPAAAAEYASVDPARSAITFTSRQMGVPVDGHFKRFKATVAFDPARPQAASASLDLELASIDAGSPEANEEVVGKNWFNTKQFPTASFRSTSVKPLGGNRFELRGPLQIKGTSREIVAPLSFRPDGAAGVFEGSFTLKRLDFKIGEGPWGDVSTVADDVLVKFRIHALPKK